MTDLECLVEALTQCGLWHRVVRYRKHLTLLKIKDEMHTMLLGFDQHGKCKPVKPIRRRSI